MGRGRETSVTAAGQPRGHRAIVTQDFDPAAVIDLDVRELIARGEEPLPTILAMADALPAGGVLHVRSPFQPTPLFALMSSRGFEWRSAHFADDDWSTWLWYADHPPPQSPPARPSTPAPTGVTDLRSLAPPEPLLWILRWTADADPDDVLRVMLPFWPTPLEPLLAQSGWRVSSETEGDDGVVVRVGRTVER